MPTECVRLRLAQASDRAALQAFLSRLSPATLHARYLTPVSSMDGLRGDRELDRLLDGDSAAHVVLLALDGEHVRGVAEFVAEDARSAEIAFVVEDAFQGRGIGRRLVRRLEQEHAYVAAIGYAQLRLRHDPLHEASYQHLMRLHALSGDRASALRVYYTCTTVLKRELGMG